MAESRPTLDQAIRRGAQTLQAARLCYGHGTDNPLDEALWLACHAVGEAPPLTETQLERILTPAEQRTVAILVDRRIETRLPVAYLTRQAWFAGLELYIDQRVLVPRSPMAELIEDRFRPWLDPPRVERCLDIGTGSGCLGIACAYALPQAGIVMTDVSEEALAVARINVERHRLKERIRILQADLFDGVPVGRYDLILSNPPYVGQDEWAALPDEYRHEPSLGLRAADAGLGIVERILQQASDYLRPQGVLAVEVGNGANALSARYPRVPFVWPAFERGGHGVFLLSAEDCRIHFPSG